MERYQKVENTPRVVLPKLWETVAPYFKKVVKKLSSPKIKLKVGEKTHPKLKRIS